MEIIFLLFLNIFTQFVLASLAYVAVITPLQEAIKDLQEKLKQQHRQEARPVQSMGPVPKNVLPSMDDMPDSAWNPTLFDYGADDRSTPEEVEEEMTDLQVATREADQAWTDLEELKHGKRMPIIYSGR